MSKEAKEIRPQLTSGSRKNNRARVNPLNHNISQNAHLHPLNWTANPATTGARAGEAPADSPYRPMAYGILCGKKTSWMEAPKSKSALPHVRLTKAFTSSGERRTPHEPS